VSCAYLVCFSAAWGAREGQITFGTHGATSTTSPTQHHKLTHHAPYPPIIIIDQYINSPVPHTAAHIHTTRYKSVSHYISTFYTPSRCPTSSSSLAICTSCS